MAGQTTGNHGAADGHQQSIGAETGQPVDGIAGSIAGTQQPSGAHVDAGGAGAVPGPRDDEIVTPHEQGARKSIGTSAGGVSGMSGQGVAQPGGVAGALGSHAQERVAQFGQHGDSMYAGNWTGAISRGGKAVGVFPVSGTLSRQHSSGK